MTRLLLLPFLLAAACGLDPDVVRIERLAPGGGDAADGGVFTVARPRLDLLVRLEHDATDFTPGDLMRLLVNGIDRTDEVVIGGNYALLRLDPPPVGTPQFVELFRRTGDEVRDRGTWNAMPFTGPTLASVAPNQAREGAQVTITGAGFAAGPVRVFFGGVEGAVAASSDTSITATVPAGASPGLVWVLVGEEAAEGVVGFGPLDANDQPLPLPTALRLFAVFPAAGGIEAPLEVWGVNFTNEAVPFFDRREWSRVLDVTPVDVPPLGEILVARAVVGLATPAGAGELQLIEARREVDPLPFTVR